MMDEQQLNSFKQVAYVLIDSQIIMLYFYSCSTNESINCLTQSGNTIAN